MWNCHHSQLAGHQNLQKFCLSLIGFTMNFLHENLCTCHTLSFNLQSYLTISLIVISTLANSRIAQVWTEHLHGAKVSTDLSYVRDRRLKKSISFPYATGAFNLRYSKWKYEIGVEQKNTNNSVENKSRPYFKIV